MRRSTLHLRGFTLIELLIVITIIGIASAMVIPYVGGRSDLRVAAVARSMVSDIQYVQNIAITTRQSHGIQFEVDKYTVHRYSGTTAAVIKHPIDKTNFVVQMGATGKSVWQNISMPLVNVRQGATRLVFDSMGTPLAFDGTTFVSTTATVSVPISSGGTTITLKIEPFTGEVNVD
jgi:prepilin-type N-terminal cleavage/methylation domain-containing protein